MLLCSMAWLLALLYNAADKEIYSSGGPISLLKHCECFILTSSLLFSLFKTNVQGTAQDCQSISVKKCRVGHQTSSPSTSKHPKQPIPGASFASFLWVAHFLSPRWSLFQLWYKPLYQTREILFCANIILNKGTEQGKLSHVQNESEFLPLIFSSQFY